MKRNIVSLIILFILVMSIDSCAENVSNIENQDTYGAKASKEDSDLELIEMLIYAIQDEYLANKEYELIMNKYGTQRPFSNIKKAEERHISMLKEVLFKNGIDIPKDDSSEYVKLPNSIDEAYRLGVEAEIENIAMYERFLQQELTVDARRAFEALKNASENHLRAFRKFVSD